MLMIREPDPLKLSSPRIFLVRMLVFVILVGLIAFVLHKQIEVAFMANPGLNALIIGVPAIGTVLSVRQVLRLYPEIAWVNTHGTNALCTLFCRAHVVGFWSKSGHQIDALGLRRLAQDVNGSCRQNKRRHNAERDER